VRNHAQAIVACDFFTLVTASFRVLYVFLAMEVGSRRLLHINVTEHPTAQWTLQQFRETLPGDHPYRFVIHDRDTIFSSGRTLREWSIHYNRRTPALCVGPWQSRNRPKPRFRPAAIGIRFRTGIVSPRGPFSEGYIMNMAWRSRPRNVTD